MTKKETIEEKTWELLSERAGALGLIPVDAEYAKETDGYALLIYIDKAGGVTIDDCEMLSKDLDPRLDEMDFIKDPYTMIVSSPGLGRVLRRPRDFIFAKEKEVELKLFKPLDGKKELTGILKDADRESVTIVADDKELRIEKAAISKIQLAVHF